MTAMHTMTMTDQGDGSYKCTCPECGRVLILLPGDGRIYDVLIVGDPLALHQGSTGGLRITGVDATDPYLAPFEAWDEAHK